MTLFSSYDRDNTVEQMKKKRYDVLIIGGGITGAGLALDATTRGLKTCLIDMQDFASGTSSRSTKLIHGGLRYLKQFDIKLVADVGRERAIVYENGPHVTTQEWMMLPFYKGSLFRPFITNIGLTVYDFLARVKKDEKRIMLHSKEVLKKEPLIKQEGLQGAGYYVEYKTDDARLTIEVIKKANEYGVDALNYIKGTDFIYDMNQKVIGVYANDQLNNKPFKVFAKKIVNATGPWVDQLMDLNQTKNIKRLHLTKGAHLVFKQSDFPLRQAIYFDGPDGRMIFAIPRKNKTYVGTTDTTYYHNIFDPIATEADRDYLLDAINVMFPTLRLTPHHVDSSWAGLRPLIAEKDKDPSEISRKDEVFIDSTGLITIAGGKLTGYRKMSEEVIDIIVEQLKVEEGILYSKSATRSLPISGGEVGGSAGFKLYKRQRLEEGLQIGLKRESVLKLIDTYGANCTTLFTIFQETKEEAEENEIDSVVFTKLIYAMKYELAYTPADFFIRRTGDLFFDIDAVTLHKKKVINYMAKAFNWNLEEKQNYTEQLEQKLVDAKIGSNE